MTVHSRLSCFGDRRRLTGHEIFVARVPPDDFLATVDQAVRLLAGEPA